MLFRAEDLMVIDEVNRAHVMDINCVRIHPTQEFVASASDDGNCCIWRISDRDDTEMG